MPPGRQDHIFQKLIVPTQPVSSSFWWVINAGSSGGMLVFATFENDLRKIADLRALTVIFNVQSWKTRKNFAKDFFRV